MKKLTYLLLSVGLILGTMHVAEAVKPVIKQHGRKAAIYRGATKLYKLDRQHKQPLQISQPKLQTGYITTPKTTFKHTAQMIQPKAKSGQETTVQSFFGKGRFGKKMQSWSGQKGWVQPQSKFGKIKSRFGISKQQVTQAGQFTPQEQLKAFPQDLVRKHPELRRNIGHVKRLELMEKQALPTNATTLLRKEISGDLDTKRTAVLKGISTTKPQQPTTPRKNTYYDTTLDTFARQSK